MRPRIVKSPFSGRPIGIVSTTRSRVREWLGVQNLLGGVTASSDEGVGSWGLRPRDFGLVSEGFGN